ncbi:serine/threonine protein kinase [Halostreptopolyspora alba]|uniref:Serine/threonine protein kinase n=2 Tax=Halostreptopolyspora alba TaxID=2487137 RepID=A0A3N0EAM7_9ACTN|nr:serine/threonine protein kinase [Nocardiopsaceae bacterium YIM 96095]
MTAGFSDGEELPARVGPYLIRRSIGQGGMGVVYQGVDPQTDQLVAIKVLKSEVAGDNVARARLHREVETMRRVQSRNVAEVIDADTSADQPWVVTEYIPGPTLDSTVTDHGPLRGRALTRFVTGLAQAIDDIHAAEVIHRDLKPGNVIISNGEPIVIDFGIAHAVDGAKLTQTGTFVGTPSYLSPEVIEGTDLGPATDVHAWGGTVAFASTGNAPYGAGSFEVIFFRILNGEITLEGMPDQLQPLVRWAVSRDMASRPTAAQLVAETSRLNLDLPWSEDLSQVESTGLTGTHTVQGATSGSGDGAGGAAGAMAAGAAAGAAMGAVRGDDGEAESTAMESAAAQAPQGRGDPAATEEADQTMVSSGTDQTMMQPGADQTMVSPAADPRATGRVEQAPPEDDPAEPQTRFFNSTLRPDEFRDILTPVGQGTDQTSTYRAEEERGGFLDRFKRSGGDRISDYWGGGDDYDDEYDDYYREAEPRSLPTLFLIPVLLVVAGLSLLVPTIGVVLGVLAASLMGALDIVKSEHARRLQTRGPRSSDHMVIALSVPWATIRNLGTTLLYGLGYLLAGIILGLVVGFLTGRTTPDDVGAFALFTVVMLSFLGPNGAGARRQARWMVENIKIRNVYVYWVVIVGVVVLALFFLSLGYSAAPEWHPIPGPSGWFS